jgi:predicted O-methyltransferase YrrM
MSISRFLRSQFRRLRGQLVQSQLLRSVNCNELEKKLDDWSRSLTDPTSYYLDCFRFFHRCAPEILRDHRAYFSRHGRGFGEDAFHTMWWLLFRRFSIVNFLEIGVYRGQTLTLAATIQRELGINGTVVGISPFEAARDSVSSYRQDVDYLADTRANFAHFNLAEPVLVRAYSTDEEALAMMRSRQWDCIYIDGSHEEEIAAKDWQNSAAAVKTGGLVVLDDAALKTSYEAPVFGFKGHPGPSNIAERIDRNRFREILQVGHNRVFQKLADS